MVAFSQPSRGGRPGIGPAYSAGMDDPTGGGHRPPAAPHPQRVRERRHRDSGHETRERRRARHLPRRHRARPRALRGRRPAGPTSSPGSRARDPSAPTLLLMGHTDVVPVNADGWQPRSVRGRAHRRRGLGPRRRRHAQPHRLDGGRDQAPRDVEGFRPKGTLIYLARRRRGSARHLRRRATSSTTSVDAVAADYVITEAGGFPMPPRRGHQAAGDRRREGHATGARLRVTRHAGSRVACRSAPTTRW